MRRSFSILVMTLFTFSISSQTEYFDLAYLPQERITEDTLQLLNLFLPDKTEAPLLIWIGGGAWSYVDHNMETNLARNFAKKGIAVAAIGHRLSSAVWHNPKQDKGVQHPAHIRDVAAAVHWLHSNASDYGYSPDKIFIGGFSSGAHLAALISMDERYLAEVGLSLDIVAGVIPISGTYDVANYHEVFVNGSRPALAKQHVEAVFGDTEQQWIDASPITYLESLRAPMLLMTDNRVDRYTRIFDEALRLIEYAKVDVVYVAGLDHGQLWRNIGEAPKSVYRDRIVTFINTYSN